MSSNTIIKWIIKIGRERALLWKINKLSRNWNVFALLVSQAFRSTGTGDPYAEYSTYHLIRKAGGIDKLYEFVKNSSVEELERIVYEELGYARRIARTLKDLVKLVDKHKLLESPCKVNPNHLYKDLHEIYGFGKKMANYTMYELIRVYDYPIPENLELLDEIKEKLKKLGLSEDETSKIPKEYYPYIDAALWDYPN